MERLKAFCNGLLRLSRGVLGSLKVFGYPTRFGAPRGSLGALPRGVFAAPSKPLGAFIKAFFAPVKTFLSLSLSVFLAAKFRPQILTPKATQKRLQKHQTKKKPSSRKQLRFLFSHSPTTAIAVEGENRAKTAEDARSSAFLFGVWCFSLPLRGKPLGFCRQKFVSFVDFLNSILPP